MDFDLEHAAEASLSSLSSLPSTSSSHISSSSTSSSDEGAGMNAELGLMLDMVGHKCSICFLADSETELANCGDQFCYECLERYWKGRLTDGLWGMRKVQFDCPVCRVKVTDTSWLLWVGSELRELWTRMKEKRAQLLRACQVCGHEQSLIGEKIDDTLEDLLSNLERDFSENTWKLIMEKVESRDLVGLVRQLTRSADEIRDPTARQIYAFRKILQESAEIDSADLLANKQLAILQICSGTICDFCNSQICLYCGTSDWHLEKSCMDFMKSTLLTDDAQQEDSIEHQTLQWKIQNTKSCPKCFLLITKDDDGSCHQMKCNYCGFKFCWECLKEWSSTCGYYQCSQQANDTFTRQESKTHLKRSSLPEAGIPDITKLPSYGSR